MQHYLDVPPSNCAFYDSFLRYRLEENICFVYGSNLRGAHGAGAALAAYTEYGAVYGQGIGFAGKSYAIPTKDADIRTLPLSSVRIYVEQFVAVSQVAGRYFFVTAVGTGLAGYRHREIAPLFKGVKNCWLPSDWEPYLT